MEKEHYHNETVIYNGRTSMSIYIEYIGIRWLNLVNMPTHTVTVIQLQTKLYRSY